MPAQVQIRAKQTLQIRTGRMDAVIYLLEVLRAVAITITDVPELVVTSISDSQHSPNSRHYRNEAIDIRSKNFPTRESKRQFRAFYEMLLGPNFRVLLEAEGTPNEHFHAQVRKGMTFS